jgi:hypothetical protein
MIALKNFYEDTKGIAELKQHQPFLFSKGSQSMLDLTVSLSMLLWFNMLST